MTKYVLDTEASAQTNRGNNFLKSPGGKFEALLKYAMGKVRLIRHRRPARLVATLALVSLISAAIFNFLPERTAHAQISEVTPPVPDYVAYQHLFHHVLALKKIADQAADAGQDRSSVRNLIRKQAGLNEAEGQLLENEAVQCDSELRAQWAKAKVIRDELRARHPYGILNPSLPAPKPDSRLDEMQQEHNNIVLLCRDRLRNALGEESFARLDNWMKIQTAPNVSHSFRPRRKPRVTN